MNAMQFLETEGFDACDVVVDVPPAGCEQAAAANPLDPCVNMGEFERVFTPWPLRFYVVDRAGDERVRVAWIGTPEGDIYDSEGLHDYLTLRLR